MSSSCCSPFIVCIFALKFWLFSRYLKKLGLLILFVFWSFCGRTCIRSYLWYHCSDVTLSKLFLKHPFLKNIPWKKEFWGLNVGSRVFHIPASQFYEYRHITILILLKNKIQLCKFQSIIGFIKWCMYWVASFPASSGALWWTVQKYKVFIRRRVWQGNFLAKEKKGLIVD